MLACFLRNVKYKSSNTYSSTYVRLLHNPLVKEGPILLFTIDFCALKQKLKLRSVRSIVLYLESQQCMNVRCAASDVGWLLELLGAWTCFQQSSQYQPHCHDMGELRAKWRMTLKVSRPLEPLFCKAAFDILLWLAFAPSSYLPFNFFFQKRCRKKFFIFMIYQNGLTFDFVSGNLFVA